MTFFNIPFTGKRIVHTNEGFGIASNSSEADETFSYFQVKKETNNDQTKASKSNLIVTFFVNFEEQAKQIVDKICDWFTKNNQGSSNNAQALDDRIGKTFAMAEPKLVSLTSHNFDNNLICSLFENGGSDPSVLAGKMVIKYSMIDRKHKLIFVPFVNGKYDEFGIVLQEYNQKPDQDTLSQIFKQIMAEYLSKVSANLSVNLATIIQKELNPIQLSASINEIFNDTKKDQNDLALYIFEQIKNVLNSGTEVNVSNVQNMPIDKDVKLTDKEYPLAVYLSIALNLLANHEVEKGLKNNLNQLLVELSRADKLNISLNRNKLFVEQVLNKIKVEAESLDLSSLLILVKILPITNDFYELLSSELKALAGTDPVKYGAKIQVFTLMVKYAAFSKYGLSDPDIIKALAPALNCGSTDINEIELHIDIFKFLMLNPDKKISADTNLTNQIRIFYPKSDDPENENRFMDNNEIELSDKEQESLKTINYGSFDIGTQFSQIYIKNGIFNMVNPLIYTIFNTDFSDNLSQLDDSDRIPFIQGNIKAIITQQINIYKGYKSNEKEINTVITNVYNIAQTLLIATHSIDRNSIRIS